jgi:hypothetical protein
MLLKNDEALIPPPGPLKNFLFLGNNGHLMEFSYNLEWGPSKEYSCPLLQIGQVVLEKNIF